jgi:hypothetical protein
MNVDTIRIPSQEVSFHPLSFGDSNGRLFWWKGQLWRAIGKKRARLYDQLFRDGIIERLINKSLLVDTALTDMTLDGYELVLRHRVIPFVSYAFEWCPEMLKAAALAVVDLEIELVQQGLTLQDAHPWNVLFDGFRPLYVDFGSIVPSDPGNTWPAYDEFCCFFTYPLELMANGHGRIARLLLRDFDLGICKTDLLALIPESSGKSPLKSAARNLTDVGKRHLPPPLRAVLNKTYRSIKSKRLASVESNPQSPAEFLRQTRREIEQIELPSLRTEGSTYYDGLFPPFVPSEEWTPKHRSLYMVLSNLHPSSTLDIGSNRGWHSQLAARLGSSVVAFDVDEVWVGQLYLDAKTHSLPILPLVMDFRNPSPGLGLCNQELAPAIQRLNCDMVLALALVHHLVFEQHLRLEQITQALSVFARRWLLVEFIPREDQHVREWWSERYSWYTLDNFLLALKREFNCIEIYPSYPEPRVLLLCKR